MINTILWLILGVLLIVVAYFLFEMIRHRHTLVIRKIINNKKIIQKVKFRIYKDKQGTEWLKIYPSKKEYIPPSSKAIDVSRWGSMWIEAYETQNGELTYIEDQHDDGNGLKPLTSSHRSLYVGQMEKAHQRKKIKWTEHLPTIVAISGFVIIIVCLMVFWQDLAIPFQERDKMVISYENIQTEQLNILKEIKLGIQRIENTDNKVVPD